VQSRGQAVTFSTDGKTVASWPGSYLHFADFGVLGPSGTGDRIYLWEAATGKQRLRLPQKHAEALALGPNGKTLAAASYQATVTLGNLEEGEQNPPPDPDEIITPPPAKDRLLVGLDKDFQELSRQYRNPDALREANKLFNQSNRGEHHWNYR